MSKDVKNEWEHDYNADVCFWPSTMNSFLPVEIPQNSVAGQQRLQISELQFDKSPTSSSFVFLKMRFQNPSLGRHVADQRSGDGRFSG